MKLRTRLAWGYGAIAIACLGLLGALAHHEFWTEAQARALLGTKVLPGSTWGDFVEVVCYSMIPVILTAGWWLMRRTLQPINRLTAAVERIHADNLREPLATSGSADEADRLTAAFDAMRARLDQSFQRVREFTLHASHELKTPLTVMRSELETALHGDQTLAPAQQEHLLSLLDEVQRLTRIVDGLTLLTKADAGLVALEWEPVWLTELVRECYEDIQILAELQQVAVSLGECPDLVTLGDRGRLRQLLLNLADNAVKYNRPGGTVTLGMRRAGQQAEITIANTGAGIPPDLQPRLFDRFVRGDEARTRGIDGSGLGLSIVRWIVEAHCGDIRITSDPGQATVVTVCLPLVQK